MIKIRISGFTDIKISSDIKISKVKFAHDIECNIKDAIPIYDIFKMEEDKADKMYSKYNRIDVSIHRIDILDAISISGRGKF